MIGFLIYFLQVNVVLELNARLKEDKFMFCRNWTVKGGILKKPGSSGDWGRAR